MNKQVCPNRVFQRAGQALALFKAGRSRLARHMVKELVGLGEHGNCPVCSANVGGRAAVALEAMHAGYYAQFCYELRQLRELTQPNPNYRTNKSI